MKKYLTLIVIPLILLGCRKSEEPLTIENYLTGKVVQKITTNPSGTKVFFLSAVIDKDAPPWICSIPYIYQLSCTDGDHTLHFENLHYVTDVAVDDDCNLYACMGLNLVKFIPPQDSATILTSSLGLTSVITDTSGNIWAGTYNEGLYYFDKHVLTCYTPENSALKSKQIGDIAIGVKNDIWVSVSGDSGSMTLVSGGSFNTWTWKELIGSNISYISHLAVDKNGAAWISYYDNNTPRLSTLSKNGTFSNMEPGFPGGSQISMLKSDYSGNIYMITYNVSQSKLYKYTGSGWKEIAIDSGEEYVYDVTVDASGYLWFGTSKGVSKMVF